MPDTIVYLDDAWDIVDKDRATMGIVVQDGERVFVGVAKELERGTKQVDPQARLRAQIEDLLIRAQDEVLSALQYDEDVDWELMADRWAASLQSPLVELLRTGLERSELAVSFDQINEVARVWAREHVFVLVNPEGPSSVIRSTREKIERIREELETEVLGWLELEDRLAPIFGDVRARGIAETEITNAFTESGRLGAKELGLTEKKNLTANDPLVCFPAWTLVETARGPVPIQWLEPGDPVWTREGLCRISRTFQHEYTGRLVRIEAGSHSLVATEDHPIWTLEQGWLKCSDLNRGQILETFLQQQVEVGGLVNFQVGDSADLPAVHLKVPSFSSIFNRILMPVYAIHFERNAQIWKEKINRESSDLGLLKKLKAHCSQYFSGSFLRKSFALKASIARKATELAIRSRGQFPEGLSAVSTRDQDGRSSTFLRTIVPEVSPVALKRFAATLTNQPGRVRMFTLAWEATKGISFSNGFLDRELFTTAGANFSDSRCSSVGDSTLHRTVQSVFFRRGFPKLFPAISADQYYLSGLGSSKTLSRAITNLGSFARTLFSRKLFPTAFASIMKWHIASSSLTYLVSLHHRLRRKSTSVYNLEIEGPPEFYANGILVHNCEICKANEEEGWILIDAEYPHSFSGWMNGQGPAFHKGCRCMEAYR